jgi:predicted DNA-binding protein
MTAKTSSIRLSYELTARLECESRRLKKPKNWIITHAIREFLAKSDRAGLAEEVRRQSILVSQRESADEAYWSEQADTSGWR